MRRGFGYPPHHWRLSRVGVFVRETGWRGERNSGLPFALALLPFASIHIHKLIRI